MAEGGLTGRPKPPPSILDGSASFVPSPELWDFFAESILSESGLIHNPDHMHLAHAHIGFLWTAIPNSKRGRGVVGMAEQPKFLCGKWQKARQELQICQWFGRLPDFLITLDAVYCEQASDSDFLALLEHEIYHCAQDRDGFGMPKFSRDTGKPVFTLAGHDVQEFVAVVRRYGVGEPDSDLARLVDAAKRGPEVAKASIAAVCGNCLTKA